METGIRVGMMKGKIHRATVTQADLNYEGSITVDKTLLDASGILPYEQVDVLNITNGERFTTYTIVGGEGEIKVNGAAAHLVKPGDLVIIVSYCFMDEGKAKTWQPKVVLVDEKNRMKNITKSAKPALAK